MNEVLPFNGRDVCVVKKIRIKITDLGKQVESCYVGYKRSLYDIILDILNQNYKVEISDEPEYVFSSVPVGHAKGYEYYQYKDKVQIQVLFENTRPDFTCFDYVIGGFHNFSYADRYLYLPYTLMAADPYRRAYPQTLIKHLGIDDSMAKRKFCSFVVSNGYAAAPEREQFFRLLSKYKTVDSGGKFLNNVGGPVVDKVIFERQHKFSIAFENAWQSVIQEKLDTAFAAQTVPIYWGNTDVKDIYNEDAFINVSDFDCFESVIDEIIRIDRDDAAYLKMLVTPAYRNPVTEEEHMKRLEKFLVNMIETPKEKAIIRTNVGWSNTMQRMRYESFVSLYKKRMIKHRIGSIARFFWGGLAESPVAAKIRRYVNSKV